MSIMAAIDTPVKCSGIPSVHNTATIEIDDKFVVSQSYHCTRGHNFELFFSNDVEIPMFWECSEHEIIAFEV